GGSGHPHESRRHSSGPDPEAPAWDRPQWRAQHASAAPNRPLRSSKDGTHRRRGSHCSHRAERSVPFHLSLDLVGRCPGRPGSTFPVHSDVPREVAGPAALIRLDGVSKWYGHVIGLNNISLSIGPGVTGLLGPNGAGKSTFLQL